MPLAGKQHQPRDIAAACFDVGWVNARNLTIAVAVMLGESQGFDEAYNDNKKVLTALEAGQVVCDVGTLEKFTCIDPVDGKMEGQLSHEIATFPLTTEWIVSRDVGAFEINISAQAIGGNYERDLYDFLFNVAEARRLWLLWGGGHNDEQAWNHWAAYKSGIVLDPNAKGHYIHKACRGVGNFLADQMFGIPDAPLLYYKGGAVRL